MIVRREAAESAIEEVMAPSAVRAVPQEAPRDEEPEARVSVTELFRAHAPFIAKFLARLGVPPGDVDDLVQEVFLVVHRRGFVLGDAKPTTYLASIAHRVASTARRTRARRRLSDADGALDAIVSDDPDPHARADVNQSLGRVGRALRRCGGDAAAANTPSVQLPR